MPWPIFSNLGHLPLTNLTHPDGSKMFQASKLQVVIRGITMYKGSANRGTTLRWALCIAMHGAGDVAMRIWCLRVKAQ